MRPWETVPEDVFEERADDPGVALCSSCLEPTRPNAHFCHTCLCPLTWYAATGPLEQVWAWPWIVWKAGWTRWPRKIHPWGVTLVFLPELLTMVLVAVWALLWPESMGSWWIWHAVDVVEWWDNVFLGGGLLLALLSFVLKLALTVRAWMNWFDRRGVDPWAEEPEVAP